MNRPAEYDSLEMMLDRAYDQASAGKGKERHAVDNAFEDQIICEIQRMLKDHPCGYQAGQAIKKVVESGRLYRTTGAGAAVAEVLGAINYLAAMCIVMEEWSGRDTREPCPATGRNCSTCKYCLEPDPCHGCGKYFANWQPAEDLLCDGCPHEETESYDEPCISCIDPLEMDEDYVERMRRDVREERAPHPGDVLRELLRAENCSSNDLEIKTKIVRGYWEKLLSGEYGLSHQAAERLPWAFPEYDPKFWLNLQLNYDAQKQAQAEGREVGMSKRPIVCTRAD